MKIKIKIILSSLIFIYSFTTKGQNVHHEFSIYGTGGISTFLHKPSIGKSAVGFGGNTGIGYTFFFSPEWGITTGMEAMFVNRNYKLSSLSDFYSVYDGTEDFEFRYTLKNYKEKQWSVFINIPLMVQYQTTGKTKFYAAAGGKIAFPVSSKYTGKYEEIITSAYYPQYNVELFQPYFRGLGTFEDIEEKGSVKFKPAIMLSAEAGIKWKLSDKWSLYTGVSIDFGLNNILKETQNHALMGYNAEQPSNYHYNSMLVSKYTQDGNSKSFTDKMAPMMIGVKIKLAFGAGKPVEAEKNKDKRPEILFITQKDKDDKSLGMKGNEVEAQLTNDEKKEQELEIALLTIPVSSYKFNQIVLDDVQKTEWNARIKILKNYPHLHFIVEGHTCDMGSLNVNINEGLLRAETVRDYLITNGIESYRLKIISKGDSVPIVPNISESNRRINRRVVLVPDKK
ncbi:MAG: OmpA family protein [Bacteroidales bacterium]|jgi:outer membrane protein OmpA-like peptidoglycan-associated protein|nr:OmpA family protein [Bacteroidales bacterium]